MLISKEHVVLLVMFPFVALANWKKNAENEVLRPSPRPRTELHRTSARNGVIRVATSPGWPRLIVAGTRPIPIEPATSTSSPFSSSSSASSASGRSRYPSAPIHGHHWPFDKDSVPTRHPVSGSHSVEGTFLWAVGLFGTVENGAIVLTMLCTKHANRPLNVLVGFLSAADLYISTIYIPSYTYFMLEEGINLTQQANRPWNPDRFDPQLQHRQQQQHQQHQLDQSGGSRFSFCHVSRWIFLEMASVALSLKTLIALYLLIFTHSRKMAARVFSPRNVAWFVASCWLGNGAIFFLPNALGAGTLDLYPKMFTCSTPSEGATVQSSVTFKLLYREAILSFHLFQLSVICVSFAKVHEAIRTGRTISLSRQEQDNDKPATYLRATKATTAIFISLALFWIPGYLLSLLDPWYTFLPQELHRTALDLLLTKSAANPLIYIYGLRSLRHEIKLFCMCRCRSDRHLGTMFRPSSTSAWSNDGQPQTKVEKENIISAADGQTK